MISLVGIFVITSSACFTTLNFTTQVPNLSIPNGSVINKECVEQFIRVSTSADTANGETATPICFWLEHEWKDHIDKVTQEGRTTIKEYQKCFYCNKKRVRKDAWEDVK